VKLASLFSEDNILIHLEAENLADAIRQIVESFGDALGKLNPETVCERLIQGEESLPVPPGLGVRIPHARLAGVDRLLLAVGTSQEGIPVFANSDERANLIFVILTPKLQSTLMLQTMSSIARLVLNEENRRALIATKSPQRVLRILEETGIEVKKAVVAASLMNPVEHSVAPGMTLREVTRVLAECREEGVPVVSAEGELLGDISTRTLIEVGLPKYMNLITNPSVLSEFEPFEAFYKKEDAITAEEVMNREILRLAPETPVEIVAHEMLTKYCERAYVVNEKKLAGVVYRKDIVRKVLFL
jgi:nitrogen PTS system EIIA component